MRVRRSLLAACCVAVLAGANSDLVRKHVADGLRKFRRGQFAAAAKAFADADVLDPDNPIIDFNRGCAEARAQNRDEARTFLKQATAAEDQKLAAAAHYNLGLLEAKDARALFGDSAVDVSPDVRQRGIELLTAAIDHFRSCLSIDPQHAGARRNIEVIRSWLAQMQPRWAKKDEERKADEGEKLADILKRIDQQQHAVYVQTHGLLAGSPQDLESLAPVINAQNEVATSAAAVPPAVQGQIRAHENADEETQARVAEARDALTAMAEDALAAMRSSADQLTGRSIPDAVESQTRALDRINEMFAGVADFPPLVLQSVAIQETTLNLTRDLVGTESEVAEAQAHAEDNLLSERERRVSQFAHVMPDRARPMNRFLARMIETETRERNNLLPRSGPPTVNEEEDSERQRLLDATKLAIRNGEEIETLAREAADLLQQGQREAAIPKQERALELLREIADKLPKKPNNQGESKDRDSGVESLDVDEDEEDKKKKDDKKKSEQQQEKQKQEQEIRNREQAEAMLRQVRDREETLRELKARLRAMRTRNAGVERDW